MGLRNLFGDISLEDTQVELREALQEIVIQLKIMNVHLEHISEQHVLRADVEDTQDAY